MAVAGHRSVRRTPREHLPFALVLLVVAVAALRIFQYHWREGAVLIGGALLLAGLLRGILPTEKAGLLAIRGKPVDVLTYAALSVLILFVALTIIGGPFGGSS
ncbi:DUF3017 domain-containing protein [Amycolatopsis sp. NPDC058986]|uniref:DUF3017 domain-containing protein n=1 Tax=unclassified Amycolatopsis TaxID=2618356 RepID=UPI0036715881